jgi:methylenetetrahydrofolate dehydrogenase (NADP+)/methenyltetrahydrofolate cyclohydrolase
VLDGEKVAARVRAEVADRVAALGAAGHTVGLGTLLVGDDGPSARYVGMKHADCAEVGITSHHRHLPADAPPGEVAAAVGELNADPAVDAYIMQYPFPGHLDYNDALAAMDPAKDADGLHPVNLGWLLAGTPTVVPCTPAGILRLLADHDLPLAGRHLVVVGRGLTIGRPLAALASLKRPDANAAVTVVHTGVADLQALVRTADVIVAAAGSPGLITPDMVAPGAVVVAAGVSFRDGKVVSDVADGVADVAGWLSPRVGGVGPMTRAMLLANTVAAAEARHGLPVGGAGAGGTAS